MTKIFFVTKCTQSGPPPSDPVGWAASRLPWAELSIFVKRFSDSRRIFGSDAHLDRCKPSRFSYRIFPVMTYPQRLLPERPCGYVEHFSSREWSGLCDQIPSRRTAANPSLPKFCFRHELHSIRAAAFRSGCWAAFRLPRAGISIFVTRFSDR